MSELGLPDHLRLGPRIGRGRQAVIHQGRHDAFGEVAVKLMEGREGPAGERSLHRFMREASLAQRVDHPNVLRILEAGRVDFGAYLVMELLRGHDLAWLLANVGTFPIESLVEIGVQTARALLALDGEGVLHRDVKPENLFLHDSPHGTCIKLTDLGVGIARSGHGASRLTRSGMFVGTANYLPPEVLDERPLDVRADIYAIGVVLFELASGAAPFTGSFRKSLEAKRGGPAPSLAEKASSVPSEVSEVVAKALAVLPDDRYATPREFASALEAVQDRLNLRRGPRAFARLSAKIPAS